MKDFQEGGCLQWGRNSRRFPCAFGTASLSSTSLTLDFSLQMLKWSSCLELGSLILQTVYPGPSHLIDGEANGKEVGSQLPILAPVLLHQGHQEAADHLRVLRVIIFLQQLQAVLWVGPESVCAPKRGKGVCRKGDSQGDSQFTSFPHSPIQDSKNKRLPYWSDYLGL